MRTNGAIESQVYESTARHPGIHRSPGRATLLLLVGITILTLGGGGALGSAHLAPTAAPHLGGPLLPGWSMFRGDSALTGSLTGSPPVRASVQWSSTFPLSNPRGNDPPYQSSPSVSQGVVYISMDNVLYAVNASNGMTVNAAYLPGGAGSGPAVSSPTLLSGNVLAIAQDGGPNNLWFQTIPGSTGSPCPLGGNPSSSSPAVAGGSVFLSDTSGNIWRVQLGTLLGCPTTPWAAPGGAAYFSTPSVGYLGKNSALYLPDDGTRTLDGFSGTTGATGAPLTGFPVTLKGCHLRSSLALLNMTNNTGVSPVGFLNDNCGGGLPSHVFAVNLTSGSVLATLNVSVPAGGVSSGFYASPALAPNIANPRVEPVYFASSDGNVSEAYFSTGPTGGQWAWGWNFTGKGPFSASPVAWGDLVLDGDSSGWFYALNASTGALVWEVNLGGPLYSSAAVVPPYVYEATSLGTLAEIGPASPPMTLSVPASVTGGATVALSVSVEALNASGVPVSGLAGAPVTINASTGFLSRSTAVTNSAGIAVFNWTAPLGSNAPIIVSFQASSDPAGYGAASASATTLVPASSGGGSNPLTVSLTLTQGTLGPSQSEPVTVSVSHLGLPVSGASVAISIAPSLGSVNPAAVTTGVGGTAQFNYTAPSQILSATAVLLVASASSSSGTGTADVPLALAPAGTGGGVLLQWQNPSPQVASLGSVGVSVKVSNSSTGVLLSNVSVSFSVQGSGGGSLAPGTVLSDAQGVAFTTYRSPSVGTTTAVLLRATAGTGSSQSSAMAEVIVVPRPLVLSWVLPSQGFTPKGSSPVGVELESNGTPVGAGVAVTLALSPSSTGVLNTSTSTTDAGGIAWFAVVPTSGVSSLTFVSAAGGGGGPYSATNSSITVPLGSTSHAASSTSVPWYLWASIALAAVGIAALVLLGLGRRKGGSDAGTVPRSGNSSAKSEPESSPKDWAGSGHHEEGHAEPAAAPASETAAAPKSSGTKGAEGKSSAGSSGSSGAKGADAAPAKDAKKADWVEE